MLSCQKWKKTGTVFWQQHSVKGNTVVWLKLLMFWETKGNRKTPLVYRSRDPPPISISLNKSRENLYPSQWKMFWGGEHLFYRARGGGRLAGPFGSPVQASKGGGWHHFCHRWDQIGLQVTSSHFPQKLHFLSTAVSQRLQSKGLFPGVRWDWLLSKRPENLSLRKTGECL